MMNNVFRTESAGSGEDKFQVEDREWAKIKSARLKDGFVDGKCVAEETVLQSGFDEGYQAGFQMSFRIAVLKGIIGAVGADLKASNHPHEDQAEELKKEISELECRLIKMKKESVISRKFEGSTDGHPEKYPSFEGHKLTDSKTVIDDRDKCFTVELQYMKEKTETFFNNCGYASLSKLIANI